MQTSLTRQGLATRAAPPPADQARTVAFVAATAAVDRHGTVILPQGIRTDAFVRNPVFLWGHDGYGGPGMPSGLGHVLGRVVALRASPEAFEVEAEFAPAEVNPLAEQALRLGRAGFLSAVSIGFLPLESRAETREGRMVTVFTAVDLLEVSLVPVPSNPEALALLRAVAAGAVASPDPAAHAASSFDPAAGAASSFDPAAGAAGGPTPAARLRAAFRQARGAMSP